MACSRSRAGWQTHVHGSRIHRVQFTERVTRVHICMLGNQRPRTLEPLLRRGTGDTRTVALRCFRRTKLGRLGRLGYIRRPRPKTRGPVGVPAFRQAAGLCRQRDDGGLSRSILAAGRLFLCRGDREWRAVGGRAGPSAAIQPRLLRRLCSRSRWQQACGGLPRFHRASIMSDLSGFPITSKWPASHPDRIQLYSLNTPNGVKASIMLEETGLPYEPHLVRFDTNDQKSAEFRSLNPYGRIPAIIDPDGPGGKPLPLFESGAILVYLADKSGQFLARSEEHTSELQSQSNLVCRLLL